MPAPSSESIVLNGHTITVGQAIRLGTLQHTEAQIIAFAQQLDPLPIHIDPEAAKKSIFGGIIASGSMLYLEAHRTWFIPMLGPTIVCGLGMRNWNFTKPHYPETPYTTLLTAKELIYKPAHKTVQVEWYFEFKAENGMLVQDLELPVLHWWQEKS